MSRSVCPVATRAAERPPKLALTAGEPAGIGSELVARLAAGSVATELIVIGSAGVIERSARDAGVSLRLRDYRPGDPPTSRQAGDLAIIDIPLARPARPGRLDPVNAAHVMAMLQRAADGARSGEFDAIVTAPVHKGIINDAGIAFTGHTEFFAADAGRDVAMMLVADQLRVALLTTHLPLSAVPAAVTKSALEKLLRLLDRELRQRFAITRPRIAVLGLNPHAGEGGHLGREEIDTIIPVIDTLRSDGLDLTGPLPADTAFVPRHLRHFDAVLAMYHDQGLPVLKHAGFGHAVNVTLGLPYVRTSVDHGTALDLAGKGVADAGSLVAATQLAVALTGSSDRS